MAGLEDQVTRQEEVIMDLSYQVDSKEKGSMLPYISGKFGYGLGVISTLPTAVWLVAVLFVAGWPRVYHRI